MNVRLQNQVTMIGSCITITKTPVYEPIWKNSPPIDFTSDFAALDTNYNAVIAKAAMAAGASGGAADAKALAEAALEDAAFILARALANHFKKKLDWENLGKVDVSRSDIVRLRMQELVNKTTSIRDLGQVALSDPQAEGRGVTTDRVTTLTAAIEAFKAVMNTPRGQIVNRSTLLKEVETDVAALVQHITDMDDLVLQFQGGEEGERFKEAWRRARIIIDSGTGHTHNGAPAPEPAVAAVK